MASRNYIRILDDAKSERNGVCPYLSTSDLVIMEARIKVFLAQSILKRSSYMLPYSTRKLGSKDQVSRPKKLCFVSCDMVAVKIALVVPLRVG
jgi:hypothetical protein